MLANCIYIGIDPGASGGIAVINGKDVKAISMPATEEDTWEALKYETEYMKVEKGDIVGTVPVFAMIEWIHPAILGVGKSSMSKLYGNYMALRAFLTAAVIPFEVIKARKWQQAIGVTGRDKNQTKWKNKLKSKAQQLFPGMKITLAVADALLIAEYCRRKREGKL